jgi:hypothetical protein
MFRSLVVILFIFIMFFQNTGTVLVMADYYINIKNITLELCINKARPELHCNGKCYLKKKLESEQKQQQEQAPGSRKYVTEVQLYYQQNLPGPGLTQQTIESAKYPSYNQLQTASYHAAIFHPPSV